MAGGVDPQMAAIAEIRNPKIEIEIEIEIGGWRPPCETRLDMGAARRLSVYGLGL